MKKPIAPKVPNEPSRPALEYMYIDFKIIISNIDSDIDIKFVYKYDYNYDTSKEIMSYIKDALAFKTNLTSFDKNTIISNIEKLDKIINAIKNKSELEHPGSKIIKLNLTPLPYIKFWKENENLNKLKLEKYNLALEKYSNDLNEYNILNEKYLLELDKYNLFVKKQKYHKLKSEIDKLKSELNYDDVRNDMRRDF